MPQAAPAKAAAASDIIQFLSRTIDWHRQWNTELQIATQPGYVLVVNDDRRLVDQIVPLAFDRSKAILAGFAQTLVVSLG